jgi:hypothetical protein
MRRDDEDVEHGESTRLRGLPGAQLRYQHAESQRKELLQQL